jgi:hypothetical protein
MKVSALINVLNAVYQPDDELLIRWLDRNDFTVLDDETGYQEAPSADHWSTAINEMSWVNLLDEYANEMLYDILEGLKEHGEPVSEVVPDVLSTIEKINAYNVKWMSDIVSEINSPKEGK